MNIAIIHDWLIGMRGGERCLKELLTLYPDADIFTLFYEPSRIAQEINLRQPIVSALQKIPGAKRFHRYMLPLYPMGAYDLSKKLASNHKTRPYDLVISVSHCAAKNVRVPQDVLHISYCLTPMRYIWDQYDAYFKGRKIEPIARVLSSGLRYWDRKKSQHVDHFIGISKFIRRRIAIVYSRSADVVYPPVRTDWIKPAKPGAAGDGFLCVSALVPYKNVHAIVSAFTKLGEKLVVIGTGPEESRLREIAGPNIEFVGFISEEELSERYRKSRAMLFAAEEDFGMTPVEMQAAGRPVIAYGKGGSLETVKFQGKHQTGIAFQELSDDSIVAAVRSFMDREHEFTVDNCLQYAANFTPEIFTKEFRAVVSNVLQTDKTKGDASLVSG